jgi:uncharacterized membrane protein YtjA (UPF0391 family)
VRRLWRNRGHSAGIAKILFFVFVVLAVVSLLFGRRVKG